MKFKTSISDLKVALAKAKTTISSKDNQPVLRNFCLNLQGNDLTIFATDLDLATVCKVTVEGAEDGVITIPGEKLFSIVNNANSDVIDFNIENKKAFITAGKFQATIQCLEADDFPSIVEFTAQEPLKADRISFLENLNRISFSISDNEARKNLLAVFINGGYIQASDGHVSSVCKFVSSIENTLIPSLAVPDLVRVLRNSSAEFIEIATTDSFLLFRLDKDLFITRLSQANFPDIPKKVLKPTEKNPIVATVEKKALVGVLNRVSITSNANSLAVNFKISDKKLELSAADLDGNISVEDIPCDHNEDIEFNVNYEYVLDICKSVSSDSITMKIHPNLRIPIRIEDGDFIALLMRLAPTSVNQDEQVQQ